MIKLRPHFPSRQNEIDQAMAPIIRDMGEIGLFVDVTERNRLSEIADKKIAEQAKIIERCAGPINPNSGPQVAKYLYTVKRCPEFDSTGDDAEDGFGATGEKALLKILEHGADEEATAFINALLVFRGYSKVQSGYLTNKYTRPTKWDGIERLRYSAGFVKTGRLSTQPNTQNWPSRGPLNVKRMIIAPPGFKLVKADFEQIEVRIFAVQAGDEIMLKAFDENLDAHSYTAAKVFAPMHPDYTEDALYQALVNRKGSDKQKLWEFTRTLAKTVRFSKQDGARGKNFVTMIKTAREKGTSELLFPNVAADYLKQVDRLWERMNPWTKTFAETTLDFVQEHRYVYEDFHGRRRCFPHGYASPNEPPNQRIQGCAAGMTNQAVLRLDPQIEWCDDAGIVNQVHDEILTCTREEKALETKEILESEMRFDYHSRVTVFAEAEICSRWSG